MNYCEIKKNDVANGPGVRISLFVSGCRHHCKGCFNEATWDFNYGKLFTTDTENEILNAMAPAYVRGLTLLGGDPLEPENIEGLLPFLRRVRKTYPEKDIWCFSGDVYEKIMSDPDKSAVMDLVDVLVDGPFVEEKRNISLQFRGSENQRLIDIPSSRKAGRVILWEEKA